MLTVELYEARIPMDRPFHHASKSRGASASVLVAVRGADTQGWGEAAPREYVTGESVESVLDALAGGMFPEQVAELVRLPPDRALHMLAGLRLPETLGGGGKPVPAAAAALETALFDVVCRRHGLDGHEALRRAGFGDVLAATPAPARVATVLDLGRDPVAYLDALPDADRALIPHVKLKAGPDVGMTAAILREVRAVLPATTVSVDANGSWATEDVLTHAGELAGLSWVEEPIAPRDWWAMAALRRAGLTIMLDESCSSEQDLRACLDHEAADLVNLRVSKCGGPLRLLAMARMAQEEGLGVQLGVQVGEVGPLWAVGRLVGTVLRSVVAVEGGRQDEWFPADLTRPAYRVDRRASLAPPLPGPGIGLEPTPELLSRCVLRAERKVGQA